MSATVTQPEPDLFARRERREDCDVAWLENLLHGAQAWMTASDIILTLQWPVTEDNKRWVRGLAEQSKKVASGQRGYRHAAHCTADELNHAANGLISQGKKMIRRGIALPQSAHAIFG